MFTSGTKVVRKSILNALTRDGAANPGRIETLSVKMVFVLVVFINFCLVVVEPVSDRDGPAADTIQQL